MTTLTIPRGNSLLVGTCVLSLLAVASVAFAGQAVPVTTCGQEVTGKAYLPADLDCTGQTGHGIVLHKHGRLELRGHTLSNAESDGVECYGGCVIVGPGAIVGTLGIGIWAPNGLKLVNVTVSGSGTLGVGAAPARIFDSRIENNRSGISTTTNLKLRNTVVTGNQRDGVNVFTIASACLRGTLSLVGVTVTGNATSPDCGVTMDCADITSCKQPRLDDASTCETSANTSSGTTPPPNWGVCSLD